MCLVMADLVDRGFSPQFVKVSDLRRDFGQWQVQRRMGVYVVYRTSLADPVFLEESRGGLHGGEEMTVSVAKLERKWVEEAHVLYYGKAGGPQYDTHLHERLTHYMRCANGLSHGHKGGRYIWQLADQDYLLMSWFQTDIDPKEVETALLLEFLDMHGKLPFANITR